MELSKPVWIVSALASLLLAASGEPSANGREVTDIFGKLPLGLELNQGQTDAR